MRPDFRPEDPEVRLAELFGQKGSGEPKVHVVRRDEPAVRDAYRAARKEVPTRQGNRIILLRRPVVLLDVSDPVVPLVVARLMDAHDLAAEYIAGHLGDRLQAKVRKRLGLVKPEERTDDIPF